MEIWLIWELFPCRSVMRRSDMQQCNTHVYAFSDCCKTKTTRTLERLTGFDVLQQRGSLDHEYIWHFSRLHLSLKVDAVNCICDTRFWPQRFFILLFVQRETSLECPEGRASLTCSFSLHIYTETSGKEMSLRNI